MELRFINESEDRQAGLVRSIESRLVEDLFFHAKGVLAGTLVLAAINLAFYIGVLPLPFILLWTLVMVGSCAIRVWSFRRYEKNPEMLNPRCWHYELAVAYFVMGTGWGLIGVYSVVFLPERESVLAIVAIAGITGSAAATSSASPIIFRLVAGTGLFPLGLALIFSPHNALPFVGAMTVCYIYVLNRASARIHETLLKSVTFGLQNETLVQTLARQSNVDPLTGLSNRRALNKEFDEAWAEAERNNGSVGLILCDIDHFKEYNDAYGHLEGDRCLQQVALALQSSVRGSDLSAARYGGEEFAVLLPRCDPQELEKVGERLRAAVQALQISHEKSSVSNQITISVGMSHLRGGAQATTDELIRSADSALYRAKEGGRNCVMGASDPPATSAQSVGA